MAQWDKLLNKIKLLDKDMRFAELKKTLQSYGYTVAQPKRGSSNFRHYSGKIYISNKTMYLYIDSIIFCSEGRIGYFNPLYNYNAKKDSYTMTLDHPMVLSFQ